MLFTCHWYGRMTISCANYLSGWIVNWDNWHLTSSSLHWEHGQICMWVTISLLRCQALWKPTDRLAFWKGHGIAQTWLVQLDLKLALPVFIYYFVILSKLNSLSFICKMGVVILISQHCCSFSESKQYLAHTGHCRDREFPVAPFWEALRVKT